MKAMRKGKGAEISSRQHPAIFSLQVNRKLTDRKQRQNELTEEYIKEVKFNRFVRVGVGAGGADNLILVLYASSSAKCSIGSE